MRDDPPETIFKVRIVGSRQTRELAWLAFILVALGLGIGTMFLASRALCDREEWSDCLRVGR